MERELNRICVYCGSSDVIQTPYIAAAKDMGRELASQGLTLVYGAGGTGMMGALADACLENGGRVIGVIPKIFNTDHLVHKGLSELHVTENLHERKSMMANLSDAFVALPGGLGTFEELFEILTWAQIGLHSKPIGVLNTNGYYDPLLKLIKGAERHGFMYVEHQALLISEKTAMALLSGMRSYKPPEGLERWVNREEVS
jgi:uncharacterized protein (TIGR00730 family)